MNMEAMNRTLAALKAADPKTFSMTSHDRCMLRYVYLSHQNEVHPKLTRDPMILSCSTYDAASILDITKKQASDLFLMSRSHLGLSDVSLNDAIKVFDNFMKTDEVNWYIISDDEDDSDDAILEEQLAEIRLGDEGPIYEK